MKRQNHHLFTLGSSIAGSPTAVVPATFQGLGVLELRDIERWVKQTPALMGEELMIVTSQLSEREHFRDRLDVLAIDRSGRLVVIELKRDDSGNSVELQALKYAARVSTMTAEEVVTAYVDRLAREAKPSTPEAARAELSAFVTEGDETDPLAALDDEDVPPRIILAAGLFRQDVTATVLFLRSFGMDVSCVQLTAYDVGGTVLLLSQVLIPLPEAKDFEGRSNAKRQLSQQRKTSKRLTPEQRDAVKAFIDAIPAGQWTSYKDVAIAATGNPMGAMGIGSHLNARGGSDLPNVYRVLNRNGQVSDGWNTTTPGLPSSPSDVRDRLVEEGVEFTADRASEAQRFTAEDWLAARS